MQSIEEKLFGEAVIEKGVELDEKDHIYPYGDKNPDLFTWQSFKDFVDSVKTERTFTAESLESVVEQANLSFGNYSCLRLNADPENKYIKVFCDFQHCRFNLQFLKPEGGNDQI